jgi:tetratricopeptide (TPR) repeat protein
MIRVFLMILLGSLAHAQTASTSIGEKRTEAARLHSEAEAAFASGDFQTAYERFNECFHLTFTAEILVDMAASLEKLGRYHDAADDLRSYLRRRPDATDRATIEKRIEQLDDRQLAKHHPAVAPLPARDDRYGAAAVGVAISAIAAVAIAGGLYGSVISDYPDLEAACRLRRCRPADWHDLEVRADASYAMFAVAGALAVVDIALWIVDAKKKGPMRLAVRF